MMTVKGVSIPYSSGKNCKTSALCKCIIVERVVSIPYSSGKNCKCVFSGRVGIRPLQFQSLIHQGKIARSHSTRRLARTSISSFNPLFIREKLQESAPTESCSSPIRRFNPLFIREKLQEHQKGNNEKAHHNCFNPLFIREKLQVHIPLNPVHPRRLSFNPLFIREKLQERRGKGEKNVIFKVSIPYSSGKNCKTEPLEIFTSRSASKCFNPLFIREKLQGPAKEGRRSTPFTNGVSIPYSSGKNCKMAILHLMRLFLRLKFQSLIHQGKIASSRHFGDENPCLFKSFNPLFIREKLQARALNGPWSASAAVVSIPYSSGKNCKD